MAWNCPNCGEENSRSSTNCRNCSTAREAHALEAWRNQTDNDTSYRVFPDSPTPVTIPVTISESEKQEIKGLGGGCGFLLFGVIWFALLIVLQVIVIAVLQLLELPLREENPVLNIVLPIALFTITVGSILITIWISRRKRNRNLEALLKEKTELQLERETREAKNLSDELNNRLKSSAQLAAQLPETLDQASALLRQAQNEHAENAFDPFWSAVENAANYLASFTERVRQLSDNAQYYYQSLSGRKHTFPVFPIRPESLPDPAPIVREFRRIVRMGQTDFHFASIWEHRKTRQVLIAGFRTLGEAVNNLGVIVERSISELQSSTSSEIARLVEEQVRTRETVDYRAGEQSRMLDNIQHHRTPPF